MRWKKQGLIFIPNGSVHWMQSHAQVPTPLLKTDRIRLYFSSRPEPQTSLTTFIDVAIDTPSHILYQHNEPILPLGKPGTFDEHGVMPGSCVIADDKIYLYYTGWSRGQTVPYRNAIGLAVSDDGGTHFQRLFEGPIVDRTTTEPYSAMSPCVIKNKDRWHMWYASGVDWISVEGRYEPIYLIKYAHSQDGILWYQANQLCIPPKIPQEANTRPSVIEIDGKFHLWFCYRGTQSFREKINSYRIGYATSTDLVHWYRDDERAGIDLSIDDTAWDSQMIAYPQVIKTAHELLLFYNGNGFGQSGFGYAIHVAE